MKYPRPLSYFLGIEINSKCDDIFIFQDIYMLDLLKEHQMSHVKRLEFSMDSQFPNQTCL